MLHSNFPCRHCAQVELVPLVGAQSPDTLRYAAQVRIEPQKGTRVQQQLQSSPSPFQSRNSSSGRGSKNSGDTPNPSSRPNMRAGFALGLIGRTSAIGTL